MRRKGVVGAIIVAAGRSLRMGSGDKLWVSLGGRPLLGHTLAVFEHCSAIDHISLVLSADRQKLGHSLVKGAHFGKVASLCFGGEERQQSVLAGLEALNPCDWVVVHDGARPLVNAKLIEQGLAAARETGAATCAVPVQDTIKFVNEQNLVEKTFDRRHLWLTQTPQVFRYDILVEAHRAAANGPLASDDATLVERLGYKVKVFMGSYQNIKVTTSDDFVLAQMLLRWHHA